MHRFFIHSIKGILQLFYPRNCEGCNTWLAEGEETMCLHCSVLLPRTGFHHTANNQVIQKFTGRVPVEHATSFVYFSKEGMMQHLLHRFKYKERPVIGRFLGKLFAEELVACGRFNTIDLIIPVPLHRYKQGKRGFNQSEVIAAGISEITGISLASECLLRTANNESQTNKTRIQRLENVKDIFKVQNQEMLKGKHILLVDDVLTTGATLESAALELLKTDGVSVSIATLAIALD